MSNIELGYLTVDDVMKIYRVSRRYVYKIAHRDRWQRHWHHGRIHYRHVDVFVSLGR